MFKGLKSDYTTRSHVCLGRPTGRFQSRGGFWIAAETAQWWSWMGQLRAWFFELKCRNTSCDGVVEMSVGRRQQRSGGLFSVEVVQLESHLLAGLAAYRPRLTTVVARRRVGQDNAGDVSWRCVVKCRRSNACPASLACHRLHCTAATIHVSICFQLRNYCNCKTVKFV